VFRETFVPGHYRASVGEHTSVFAVEVEPSESRTAPVETPEAEASDHARQQVSVAVPRWRMLIVFVALLLGLEAVLRWRRRTRSHG
jgi:hypothetical protein